MFGSVKSGALTSKVSTKMGRSVVVGNDWQSITRNIYYIMAGTVDFTREKMCVYRTANIKLSGENALDISDSTITIPIPVSCTINLNFVKEWSKHHNCCVFKIHLTPDTLYLPMEKPSQEHSKDDQDEILIPAGILHISEIYNSDIGRVIEGDLEPWTWGQLQKAYEVPT